MNVKQIQMVRFIVMAVTASWMLIDGRAVLAASDVPAKAGQTDLIEIAHATVPDWQATDHPHPIIATNDNNEAKFEAGSDSHHPCSPDIDRVVRESKHKFDPVAIGTTRVEERPKFSYSLERPRIMGFAPNLVKRHYLTSLEDTFAQGKLMFDLSLHDNETGQPLFGLRLAFPFGR